MEENYWYKCRFLESSENLKPLVKKRFGREPSSSIAREIASCLQQGRLFYEAATSSPLQIRPLQLFYGMLGFSKALIVAHNLRGLSTLKRSHGLIDISTDNSRIADLQIKILNKGTFQEFNDAVCSLTRVCYTDASTRPCTISVPSDVSDRLSGIKLSLREILARIPGLESLYRMTFEEDPLTEPISLETAYRDDTSFRIRIDDRELFTDRDSLRRIIGRWRSRFPFLNKWRLHSAEHGWGNTIIYFQNASNIPDDEFAETHLEYRETMFQTTAAIDQTLNKFTLQEGLAPLGGGYTGGSWSISPVGTAHISEFSLQYLGMFLLSSLIRYRPQIWTHAISGSFTAEEKTDDKALSLIERFLDLNRYAVPVLVIKILNPYEDGA